MKSMLSKLLRAAGVAMLIMWSAGASAQEVFCDGITCTYGPICPDGWGGCYFYTWSIGSAKNAWTEKSGIANILKDCDGTDPNKCVRVSSQITTVTGEGPNALIICQVPGAKTCTDSECGGSPDSSGAVFLSSLFSQTVTTPVFSSGCTKDDKLKGGITCSKENTLKGLEGDPAAAAQFCPSKRWEITKWLPLNWTGITAATGPTSSKDLTPITTVGNARCWLLDPQGRKPNEAGYQLSSVLAQNQLLCVPVTQ
jgi:hypothetical protein